MMVYRGLHVGDTVAISGETSLWQSIQVPYSYLSKQWPIKCSVISPDGKYIAVAGRRGLTHFSLASGRWKTFGELELENEFSVRGGMCWYQHILLAAVEVGDSFQVRIGQPIACFMAHTLRSGSTLGRSPWIHQAYCTPKPCSIQSFT